LRADVQDGGASGVWADHTFVQAGAEGVDLNLAAERWESGIHGSQSLSVGGQAKWLF